MCPSTISHLIMFLLSNDCVVAKLQFYICCCTIFRGNTVFKEGCSVSFDFDWNAVSSGAPYVTISKLGIAFNESSINRLGAPEEIMIGFDEAKLTLAVKAYNGEENVSHYKFASRIRQGWIRIGCRDFINYLGELVGMDYSKACKYVATYDRENSYLMVNLQQGGDGKNSDDDILE